jgi:hypothetical protein
MQRQDLKKRRHKKNPQRLVSNPKRNLGDGAEVFQFVNDL